MNRVKFGENLTVNAEPNLNKENFNKKGVETLRHEPKLKLCNCGNKKSIHSLSCRECELSNRKTKRPSYNQLIQDFKDLKNFVQVGKKYGVTDNSVRKWLKIYCIDEALVKTKSSAQTKNSVVKTIV